MVSSSTQTASSQETDLTHEQQSTHETLKPTPEYITYSKGVQTETVEDGAGGLDEDTDELVPVRPRRRSSRKQKETDEEIRASIRREIEDELHAIQNGKISHIQPSAQQRFPLRQLTDPELDAVTTSNDFQAFVERSAKVIERALDEEYDLLADYSLSTAVDAEDDYASKTSRTLRELLQLHSHDHAKRRMVTDIHFSPHFPELLLTSYTKNTSSPNEPNGLVLVWNIHAPSRPEYVFYASSDVLVARFSPFHRNLIVGGCYNGQVCIWDTRSAHRNGQPERRTPPANPSSNLGHTHPIFSLNIVGTPNAHNILTADTDGVVCSWSFDMLAQAQEYLVLSTTSGGLRFDDVVAPMSMSFPVSDPTFFLVGSEEGPIYACHRYDRAGAKAGIDTRLKYDGHTAPVMSTQYHPGRGPVDISDFMLSSSSDWTVKLWRVRSAATTTTAAAAALANSDTMQESIRPILDIPRDDLVYDAKWSPNKPAVFAAVTGAGDIEVFDLLTDIEVPVVRASPSKNKLIPSTQIFPFRGLNKLAWEGKQGKLLAVGGLDGVVTVYEVGRGLYCGPGEADVREWQRTKNVVSRLERELSGGKQ